MRPRFFQHSLRNRNINYRHGRFFVTIQVEHNKSLLGAIVGERSVLNELGEGVKAVLEGLPLKYAELELGEYVIMPNHIHAIFDIKPGRKISGIPGGAVQGGKRVSIRQIEACGAGG